MASFSGNFSSQYAYSVLYLDYSYSQDINTNKTTFNYTLRIQKNASTTQSYQANCPFGLNIGGKNLGGTFNLDLRNVGVYGSQTIKSGSLTFDHNDSGKLNNISCSASVDTSTGLGDASLSGSVPIPDIPRASKFGTIENFNVEGTIVIPLTKYVSSWTDNLTIKLDDVVIKTINNVSNNQEIVFTEEELETIYTLMTNDNKKTFTFENVTLNGDTQIGSTQTTTAEGTITDANPILSSFVYEDVNPITLAVTNDSTKIINGKSTLNITNLVANAVKGASLKLVQVNGVQYNYTDNFSVGIENYKGNTIVLYVIDSRNNSSKLEVLIGINFIDYSEPVIKNRNIERKNYIDEVSELSVDGSFTNINFGGSENTLTAAYKYKETGSSNWNDGLTDLEINIDNNLFNIDQAIKGDTSSGFDTTNSYDIKIIINDLLSTKEETITLITGKPAMDVYKDKISFGGIADETSEFQTQFKDKANFENGIYENGKRIGGEALPIGSMMPCGSNKDIPSNWKICDGSELSRETYAELFKVIGTCYGEGDGETTFNLPDKRGRVSVGLDEEQEEFNSIGLKGGSKYLQKHNHIYERSPLYYAEQTGSQNAVGEKSSLTNNVIASTHNAGEGDSGNLQPYEVDVWIIKVSNVVGVLENENANVIDNLTSTSTTDVLSANMGREISEKLENSLKQTKQVYSLEEKVVGTWHNNKPIYRKVIITTTPATANQWTDIDTGIENIDEHISKNISYKVNNLTYFADAYENSTYRFLAVPNGSKVSVLVGIAGWCSKPMTMVLEYTKTTD